MIRAFHAALLAGVLLAAGCGASGGAGVERTRDDPAGDVAATAGPDIVAATVERDNKTITFQVRFTTAPPLELSKEEGWVDMLLIGIDVPPLGSPPVAPGGEWGGADYALGMHGPFERGMLVRLTAGSSKKVADIPLATDGRTLSLVVPRSALGDPGTLALSIAAAREWNRAADEPAGVAPDVVPDAGTWMVEFGE